MGVLYILDEPSIGLHQRDNERLLKTLEHLRDLGNTVIVVEHDEEAMRKADYLVDIGPGAGVHGGKIVAAGSYEDVLKNKKSITGQYLSGAKQIAVPAKRNAPDPEKMLNLTGANGNNLDQVSLSIPCGLLTCVTGVSGSGKSTLINHTLYPIAATELNKATTLKAQPYEAIDGLASRQSSGHRSKPYRSHTALQSRNVYGSVYADSRVVCPSSRSSSQRLQTRTIQL